MCPQIRELFVTLLIFCDVGNPTRLFETYHHQWWDDFNRITSQANRIDPAILRTMVLCDIERRLQVYNNFKIIFYGYTVYIQYWYY